MKKLLLFLAVLTLAACHTDEPPIPEEPTSYGRTVMVYMAMQNSLGSNRYHKADSAEIANAMGYIPENDRMLLFIDDDRKPRIYELSRQLTQKDPKTGMPYGPKLLKTWDTDLSSACPATLTEVLRYMRSNYESESYALVMGSHATGWLPAGRGTTANSRRRKTFGIDVNPDGSMRNDQGVAGSVADQMEIDELALAIEQSGVHPEYVLFDACLMQNIEVDYALRRVTDYIIASPISISAEGAYYTDLVMQGLFTADPADVARSYVAYYKGEGSIPYTDGYGTVVSCVRTAAMDDFAALMRRLLFELAAKRSADGGEEQPDLVEAFRYADLSNALAYHAFCSNFYYRPHFYDLLSAVEALGADARQMDELRRALDGLVVYRGTTESFWVGPGYSTTRVMPKDDAEWCGVSMFVPQQTYTTNASRSIYGDLNECYRATGWYKAVFR